MEEELLSRRISIENKVFFFDLKYNPKGKYLKITEKSGDRKNLIVVPETGLREFKDTIEEVIRYLQPRTSP